MRTGLLILTVLAAPLAAQDAPPQFEQSRTTPLSSGQWRYGVTATGSEARFGTLFSVGCNRSGRLVTLRRSDVAGSPGAITIVTDLGIRTLPANGIVVISDPVLDAIAFSRGRFIVSGGVNSSAAGSASRLVIPASPEAARSIEDCRL